MEFSAAIRSGFRNYVVFSGRVSRSELWFWFLFYFLLLIAAGFIDSFLGLSLITGRAYPSDPGLTTCWVCGCHRRNVRLMFCHAQPLEVRPPDVPRRLRGALSR